MDAVLDGDDACQERIFYALRTLGVGHTTFLLGGGFVNGGGDLVKRELRGSRGISCGEHTTCCCQLNPIGSRPQYFAYCVAYLIDSIGDSIGYMLEAPTKETYIDAARIKAIAMTTCLRNERDGNLHAWSSDDTAFDGHL